MSGSQGQPSTHLFPSPLPARGRLRALAVCGLLAVLHPSSGHAAELEVGGGFFAGLSVSKQVKTLKELREEKVVLQRLDYSCGSAALATLLRYEFDVAVSEQEIIEAILKVSDIQRIMERKGFSLLDLKRFIESRGFTGVAYRLDLGSLAEMDSPAIVPISILGYYHFIVVRGIEGGRVFLSDPARGRLTLPVGRFEHMWYAGNRLGGPGGIAFVVLPPGQDKPGKPGPPLRPSDRRFVADERILSLVRQHSFSVPPVPGEF